MLIFSAVIISALPLQALLFHKNGKLLKSLGFDICHGFFTMCLAKRSQQYSWHKLNVEMTWNILWPCLHWHARAGCFCHAAPGPSSSDLPELAHLSSTSMQGQDASSTPHWPTALGSVPPPQLLDLELLLILRRSSHSSSKYLGVQWINCSGLVGDSVTPYPNRRHQQAPISGVSLSLK